MTNYLENPTPPQMQGVNWNSRNNWFEPYGKPYGSGSESYWNSFGSPSEKKYYSQKGQHGSFDEFGRTDFMPQGGIAPFAQFEAERIAQRRKSELYNQANNIRMQNYEMLGAYRPGGMAQMMSPTMENAARGMERQAQDTEAPNLMWLHDRDRARRERSNAKKWAIGSSVGQVLGAVGGAIAGGPVGALIGLGVGGGIGGALSGGTPTQGQGQQSTGNTVAQGLSMLGSASQQGQSSTGQNVNTGTNGIPFDNTMGPKQQNPYDEAGGYSEALDEAGPNGPTGNPSGPEGPPKPGKPGGGGEPAGAGGGGSGFPQQSGINQIQTNPPIDQTINPMGMGGPGAMFDGMGQEHLPMGVPEAMALPGLGLTPDVILDTALQADPELYGESFNDIREYRLASIMLEDDVQGDYFS